jgi:uncharacterized protein with ATP-grasp and redox domains
MKGQLLCLPCTVRAAYDIAAKATDDEELRRKVIFDTLSWLAENPLALEASPTVLHTHVFRLAQRITGNLDPFKPLKKVSNEVAMRAIHVFEREYKRKDSKEGFRLAVLGAICGNAIDFEVEGYKVSMEGLEYSLLNCLKESLALDDTSKLMDILSTSGRILYLLDNAGEIVFDKFIIKVITGRYPVKVSAAVKSGPILNDVTMEDARQVRLGEVAEVITTGNSEVGLKLDESSEEFLERLHGADIIIAKGQGYYESITEIEGLLPKPIVYILRAKCVLVADALGVPQNGNVVKVVA